MVIRTSCSRLRHLTLGFSVLVVVVLVLSFVEERGDEVKNTICNISRDPTSNPVASVNLRANNGSDECAPR
jgi:hypothetical protein